MWKKKCKNCIFRFNQVENKPPVCIRPYYPDNKGIVSVDDEYGCKFFESRIPKERNYIETAEFVLRKIYEEDAEEMYQNWESDENVMKYLTGDASKSIEETKDVIRKWEHQYNHDETFRNWGVVWKATGNLIGSIVLIDGVIGCVLSREYQNKGIMTEVLKQVIDWAFIVFGYNELKACCEIENVASERIMQKAGMSYLETCMDNYKNQVKEKKWYRITKEEFQKQLTQKYKEEKEKEDIDFYLTNKGEIDRYYPEGVLVICDRHLYGHHKTTEEAEQDMWNFGRQFPKTYTMVENGVVV